MMTLEAKDIITLTGIIVSLIIGFTGLAISFRSSKKTAFVNSVTSSRAKWIDTVRTTISEYCGLAYQIHYTASDRMNKMDKLQQLRFLLKLQLNPKDRFDENIIEKIDQISESTYAQEIQLTKNQINELVELSQDLLKLEWEGVKEESKSGNLSKRTKRKLYNKYLKNKANG